MSDTSTVKESSTAQPSNTPRTNAAELDQSNFADWGTGPSGYVDVDFAQTLERENAALREQLAEAKDWGEPVAWCWMDEEIGFGLPPDAVAQEATLLYAKKEKGK
jgi:hypothetical protein